MPHRTPPPESSQSIPEMVDELTRQEIATWYKEGKLTPHGRQLAKLLDRALVGGGKVNVAKLALEGGTGANYSKTCEVCKI